MLLTIIELLIPSSKTIYIVTKPKKHILFSIFFSNKIFSLKFTAGSLVYLGIVAGFRNIWYIHQMKSQAALVHSLAFLWQLLPPLWLYHLFEYCILHMSFYWPFSKKTSNKKNNYNNTMKNSYFFTPLIPDNNNDCRNTRILKKPERKYGLKRTKREASEKCMLK